MKFFFFAFAILFISTRVFAFTGYYNYYSGTIGKLTVEMTLYSCDTSKMLQGSFYSKGDTTSSELIGFSADNETFVLYERLRKENYPYWDTLWTWSGILKKGTSIEGVRKNYRGNEQMNFSMSSLLNGKGINASLKTIGDDSVFRNRKGEEVGGVGCTIDYIIVSSGNKKVDKKINTYLFNDLMPFPVTEDSTSKLKFPAYDKMAKEYVEDYSAMILAGANVDSGYFDLPNPRADVAEGAYLVWNGCGIVSFSIGGESYDGGAHPNQFGDYITFNLATGNPITLDEIFLPGYQLELRKHVGENLSFDWGPDGGRDSVELLQRFSVTQSGILFDYGYAYSSYVGGPQDAFVKWSEMNEWIDPQGPIAWVKK